VGWENLSPKRFKNVTRSQIEAPASDIGSLPNRYVLADEVLGIISEYSSERSSERLGSLVFGNYSPATREDVSWWTGWPLSIVKTVLSSLQTWYKSGFRFQSPLIIPKGQLAIFYNARADFPQVALLPYEDH